MDISDDKCPIEGSSQPQVEGKGADAMCRNWRLFGCLQWWTWRERGSRTTGGGQYTHLGTCIDQEPETTGAVHKEEEAT